jgi:hypothetical protein
MLLEAPCTCNAEAQAEGLPARHCQGRWIHRIPGFIAAFGKMRSVSGN